MALRSPALFMGNPAVNHTAQSMRLAKAGLLRPETGQAAATRPLTAASGVLAGPAGTMGEVTLLSNTQFTVNPARWFIESTDTPLGGVYEVTNDAVETIAVTAQDATQFRKAYFGVWVIDSFVAGSGDDQPHWGLVNGPLAASNPQLPAAGTLPENFLALGEFLIPPTGQSVTWTAYSLATGPRGGILPVSAADTRLPSHDGAARHLPGQGLQLGVGGAWINPGIGLGAPVMTLYRGAAQAVASGAFTTIVWDTINFDTAGMAAAGSAVITCKRDGYYWLQAGWDANASTGGRRGVEITRSRSGGGYVGLTIGRMNSSGVSQDAGIECSGIASLLAGDLLHVDVWQDSGATVNTGNPVFGGTMFSAAWLRPL